MDNIRIEATERTPEVKMAFDDNAFAMRGEAYPENVNEFFGPLMEKFESHLKSIDGADITFDFELIYFNSSTAKILMMLFEMLDAAADDGNQVTINWIYESDDDNMEELGDEYGSDLEHATFNLVARDA